MERTVKIKLPGQAGLEKFEVSARTFGELKKELKGKIDFEGKRTVIKETKHSLDMNGSVLPDFDFILFLQPLDVKSGVDYSKMSFHKLRSECSKMSKKYPVFKNQYSKSPGNYGTAEQMRKALSEFKSTLSEFKSSKSDTPVTKTNSENSELKIMIVDAINLLENIKDKMSNMAPEEEETFSKEYQQMMEELSALNDGKYARVSS